MAELKITLSPFSISKALYQAVLVELRALTLAPNTELDMAFFKDLVCTGFSSKAIEAALWKCMERATIDGLKVSEESFEPADRRGDYPVVFFEVARENIAPFVKSLLSEFGPMLSSVGVDPTLRPVKATS